MVSIQNAGYNDLHIIHDLAHRIWPYAYGDILSPEQLQYMLEQIYSLASLQEQFTDLQHTFLLVTSNNRPIGFASFSPKEKNSKTYRLHKIYLLPQQQGTGIGKLLLKYVINTVTSLGADSLELNVNRHNKARFFYEKEGFAVITHEDIDIKNGFFMNDYVMKLAIDN